jgi:hypothetical protein
MCRRIWSISGRATRTKRSGRYSKLKDVVAFQKELLERISLGFELPSKMHVFGPNGPKIDVGDVELLAVNALKL